MEGVTGRLRQVSIWLPVVFVGSVAALAVLGLGDVLPSYAIVLVIAALTAVGAGVFSLVVFRIVSAAQRETEQRTRVLAAVNEAGRAVTSELELPVVLQRVVELSREVGEADYGALALLGPDGRIEQFLTSGMSREERERIGALPEGHGLLGEVIHRGMAMRVDQIGTHPASSGFPANHPPMTSFIGLPIVHEGNVLGDLYLTDKRGGEPFTRGDEELLRAFATYAAIAIENAQLYAQVQDMAVLEERDRIGMDLHDGVIQSLYATGLKLETCLDDLEHEPAAAAPELQQAIDQLNQVIADIRGYIFRLRPSVLAETDLAGAVGGLLQELKVNELMDVQLIEEPDACRELSEEQTTALFHVAQESLTNIRKHAQAHSVRARLAHEREVFSMTIQDDGDGFDPEHHASGLGLRNMRERVESLGGKLEVRSGNGSGTELHVELPLRREA